MAFFSMVIYTNYIVGNDCVELQVTAQQLNIRSYPSTTGTVIGKLQKNDIVCAYNQTGNWIQIKKGWVGAKYVVPFSQNNYTYFKSDKKNTDPFIRLLLMHEIILAITLISGLILLALWFVVKYSLFFLSFGMIKFREKDGSSNTYIVKDVWLTIKVLSQMFITILFFFAIFLLLFYFGLSQFGVVDVDQKIQYSTIFSAILDLILVIFYIRTFLTFNQGYVIDVDKGVFLFPATDVENKILDIFTLKRLRDYARTKQVSLSEITDIYIDTKKIKKYNPETKRYRQEPIYTLNIVGTFGSHNLEFSSRQKRDEVRGILVKAARDKKIKIKDRKVAEFS
jgi:hypothetical protein